MPTTYYQEIELLFDTHLPEYLSGRTDALDHAFALLGDRLVMHPQDYAPLVQTIALIAVGAKSLPLLNRLVNLASQSSYRQALLLAIQTNWRPGYTLLRAVTAHRSTPALSMAQAFAMRDPAAYEPTGSRAQRAKEARSLWLQTSGSKDDLVEYLSVIGLAPAIPFAMGIAKICPDET